MSSELKLTNIKHPSSGSNNLVLASDGNVSITNTLSAGTIGNNVAVQSSFGVTDVSSSFTILNSGSVMFTGEPLNAFKFNGFVFMSWAYVWPSSVADGTGIISIGDTNLYPSHYVHAPATSYEGDTVSAIRCNPNAATFTFIGKLNPGNTGLHLSANFYYRCV
jgi:hypothetical protein